MDMPQSVDVAARCVESGRKHGVDVETWPATTPADNPVRIMEQRGFSVEGFSGSPYSRFEPSVACFYSHAGLWTKCANEGEPLLILEHDAVFVGQPLLGWEMLRPLMLCNLGKPSYGSYKTPDGASLLTSKPHFPGTHGYHINPEGARRVLAKAATEACTPDLYLHRARFSWLTELHPWPIECQDHFTTIQAPLGCKAKHRKVEII